MAEVKEGYKVLYVPEQDHALDRDVNGELVYLFAYEDGKPFPEKNVGTLTRQGNGGPLLDQQGKMVVPQRPRRFWDAIVMTAHADGTADLDVKAPNGCVTLHYDKRRQDDEKKPGTFHVQESE